MEGESDTPASMEEKSSRSALAASVDRIIVAETMAKNGRLLLKCPVVQSDVQAMKEKKESKGMPLRFILGKSKMILGFAEGFPTMLKGEIAMFLVGRQYVLSGSPDGTAMAWNVDSGKGEE
ncbi:hypothetical protein ZEAMMB73_Zm00001d038184 [Zea mays]|uniref:Rotamase n=1 Tax=Zea mays TaxID=4577 RepID=A0A1D6M490_MAIZE|nr:hypothetical protein ZEAMMB73_Zm00001d038184 [Zea mays]